ncbi:hypothetical protein LIER_32418 [Lithospermum erythrorhizon]|uniref:DDE Tnp4 domain-containing protein n=1 Tax=Lithospermum erythrorhizon TaxID=34254 RepID=A0AAV3RWW6_LITER
MRQNLLEGILRNRNGFRTQWIKNLLVDAGYTNGPGFLALYRNTRYHLKLWRGNTPQNYKELFNLRHSSARNSIEWAFGLLKKRWEILRTPNFYPLKTQIRVINACWILHNFLRDEMPDDELLDQVDKRFENNTEGADDFEHEIVREEEDQITSIRVTNEWTAF